MTIGSSYDYPAVRGLEIEKQRVKRSNDAWLGRFPGPPDLCFNYRKLVDKTKSIAEASNTNHRIAIIGAGITGIVAARELYKCGFTDITLIEKDSRISGRHHTIFPGSDNIYSPFEMGAMRMPFFNIKGEAPTEGQSLMAYYSLEAKLATQDFPNPGTKWTNSTGIYLKEGKLNSTTPEMLIWRNPDGNTPPPSELLEEVFEKWKTFEKLMVDTISKIYGTPSWEEMWLKIVARYQDTSFRQFVLIPAISSWNPNNPGDFGGLGLSEDQSDIFYSIGFGDGSWGAFYDICTLYPLRTAIFGFSSNLQLIPGRYESDGKFNPGPYYDNDYLIDSLANRFAPPKYKGLKALCDGLLYTAPTGKTYSLYKFLLRGENGSRLYTSTSVIRIEHLISGKNRIFYKTAASNKEYFSDYDSIIITVPSWILEINTQITGFSEKQLPYKIQKAYKSAHWESSCKVYAPISNDFFSAKNNKIPSNLVTDTFVHDAYIYKYTFGGYQFSCILMSYTWEDDANKFTSFSDEEIMNKCSTELDRILENSNNIKQKISGYIDLSKGKVWRWYNSPYSLGCAKLYRPSAYSEAISLLSYNRNNSKSSGLYFAGESFSVDAGWTEPCFRGAIDAVINICNNTNSTFNDDFSMKIYPEYRDK